MNTPRQQSPQLGELGTAALRTASAPVAFAQLARLELDELLLQLVDRAQEVLATQGRLRNLLSATQLIASDLDMPALLRRTVTAACGLVDADRGALRVVDRDGRAAAFVGTDVSESELEELERDADRGQLATLRALSVPVLAGTDSLGTLVVIDKRDERGFTPEDREVLAALAYGAGMAIRNARLLDAAERRRRWLEASADIRRELLTEGSEPLALITERARELMAADFAAIVLKGDDETLVLAAADGRGAEALWNSTTAAGTVSRSSLPLASVALDGRRSLVVDDAAEAGMPLQGAGIPSGPAAVVHLDDVRGDEGLLLLTRDRGTAAFTSDELEMASSFASHAAVAVHLEEAERGARRAAVLEDRERIARNLHGAVIQQLFSTGLRLQSIASRTQPPIALEIGQALDELDSTIKTVRLTIFQLHNPTQARDSWSTKLAACAAAATEGLGFAPVLEVAGPVETFLDDATGERMVDTLYEALENVHRHAHAHRVTVRVTASSEILELVVDDDGVGIDAATAADASGGLARMRNWADELGGACIVKPNGDGLGTAVCWRAPAPA